MNAIVRIAALAASSSILSAVPVTWYLNNVTFTDGGRAFGNFTYDSATGALTAVNIQTTPAAPTVNASSAVGGGSYTRGFPGPVFPLPSAVVFQSGGIGGNLRRLQILPNFVALSPPSTSVPLTGTEGFCDPNTCTTLVGSVSRSIATGQVVTTNPNSPVTWYVAATLADGSQAVGNFDFTATSGTYANVDIAITPGSAYTTAARLRFARAGITSPTDTIFQSDQVVKAGTRVFVLSSPASLATAAAGSTIVLSATSYQDTCSVNTTSNCPANAPQTVVAATLTNTKPTNYTKVVSQVADGAGWVSTLILTNTSDGPAPYAVNLAMDDGTPFEASGIGSWTAATVPPGGTAFLTTSNPGVLTQGSAVVTGGQNFSVNAIFTARNANAGGDQQGSVSGDPQGNVFFAVPFDNTTGAIGFALTNTSPNSVTVLTVAYDETGKILLVDSSLTLAAGGHTAFSFASRPAYSALTGKRGSLRVYAIHPGATPPYPGLNGLLLKFLPNGSFTTIAVNNQ